MYIDRDINAEEYPFRGTFYINGEETLPEDGDLFGGTSISEETIVLETECDVTETSRAFSAGAITASYDVYFPHIGDTIIDVQRGMMFRCNTDGINVSGIVVSVGVSKLGGIHAYIKSTDV